MRIYLTTTPNTQIVSFNYQQKLVGVMHKWIGACNKEHNNISLYSFSWLKNGKMCDNGIDFKNGAKWFISFHDDRIIKTIIKSILADPFMFCGMKIYDIAIEDNIDIKERERFLLSSPILNKRKINGNDKYYSFKDNEANQLLKETFITELHHAEIKVDQTFDIYFDSSYEKKKMKMVTYDGIKILANLCPIIIKGNDEIKKFAWNCGIGNSTGIGFGSIY